MTTTAATAAAVTVYVPCDAAALAREADAVAAAIAAEAAARWLTGEEAFVAKLHPEFAPFAEYDQLMRRDEWYGRER